jgi:hypothetical protein
MDIHKPKPWHGVREFLKEYLIIVVGVLTALAAEQAVEWLHHRHQIEDADTRIILEARENLMNAYERIMGTHCTQGRVRELRDALLQPGPAWKAAPYSHTQAPQPIVIGKANTIAGAFALSPMPLVAQGPIRTWPDTAWTTAIADGVSMYMKPERARDYTQLFGYFQRLRDYQTTERQTMAELSTLAFDRTLSASERNRYLDVLSRLNYAEISMDNASAAAIARADAAGIRIRKVDFDKQVALWRDIPQLKGCLQIQPVPLASD